MSPDLTPTHGQFLVYKTEDGRIKLDVRFEGETVWLTQPMLAELFQTTVPNISMHIRNIYEEGELAPEATLKNYLMVRNEGARQVKRLLDYYNLDMIISVGYRIKSHVATRFRIWATARLREIKLFDDQHAQNTIELAHIPFVSYTLHDFEVVSC
jgi:hypothetical protein